MIFSIALIRLDKPLQFYYDAEVQTAVIPICLPWNEGDVGRNLTNGTIITVAGWGRSTNLEHLTKINVALYNAPTPYLQKLDVPLVSEAECLKVTYFRKILQMDFDLQFCAGGEDGVYFS